ncbi:MAG: DUF1549 domain-containing protein [Planctomycetota bacterium]
MGPIPFPGKNRTDSLARVFVGMGVYWLSVIAGGLSMADSHESVLTAATDGAVTTDVQAADSSPSKIDFCNDVLPIMTKLGCNAGACHGAAIGRGGFKLSLYGGNPESDYESIVQELGGRRVNPLHPKASLIYRKPTDDIEHDGGMVLDPDSVAATIVLKWLDQGIEYGKEKTLDRLRITPDQLVVEKLSEPIPLTATAHYSDGTTRDVTQWTTFEPEDRSAIRINEDHSNASVLRKGRHVLVARYATKVVPIEFVAPVFEQDTQKRRQSDGLDFIDANVDRRLEMLGFRTSGDAKDGAFLRRVTLDLTGRLPSVEKTRSFLNSIDSQKRDQLVNELLQSPMFDEHWTRKMAQWLKVDAISQDDDAKNVYQTWIEEQIRRDTSFQEIAWDLVTASGDTRQVGPANFYRTTKGPDEQAEFFSEFFMGSRLRCANCHNHPLDRWTQDDYHGLAAIFAKVELGQVISDKPSGRVIHPVTMEEAQAKIPGETELPTQPSLRIGLASWLTDEGNPYLSRVFVNRLWSHMMGRGLVEPVDDFRATNPATHPQLLDQLARDFAAHDFSLRHTLRSIALSDAYARSSEANQQNNKSPKRAK